MLGFFSFLAITLSLANIPQWCGGDDDSNRMTVYLFKCEDNLTKQSRHLPNINSLVNGECLYKSLWEYLHPSNPQKKNKKKNRDARLGGRQLSYHGSGSPQRGMVFTGMDPYIPAGLKHVYDRLHADIELWHPHHLQATLRILDEAHLSARLQGNTCEDQTEKMKNIWYTHGRMIRHVFRSSLGYSGNYVKLPNSFIMEFFSPA